MLDASSNSLLCCPLKNHSNLDTLLHWPYSLPSIWEYLYTCSVIMEVRIRFIRSLVVGFLEISLFSVWQILLHFWAVFARIYRFLWARWRMAFVPTFLLFTLILANLENSI
nr:unnamed protein product [Callosobruchus analis]